MKEQIHKIDDLNRIKNKLIKDSEWADAQANMMLDEIEVYDE